MSGHQRRFIKLLNYEREANEYSSINSNSNQSSEFSPAAFQ